MFLDVRNAVITEVRKVVVGQDQVIDQVLIALASGGHALLEGVPGTAKTLLANAVSKALGLSFRRAQFTPDMLPSDLTGTMALVGGQVGELSFRPGPVFTNILLADEINRTPPKTQAALLEAMGEGTVSVDGTTHPLPEPFLVLATQNPIEYEGTYPLPEAQLDRFLLKINVGYPSEEAEIALLKLRHVGVRASTIDDVVPVATAEQVNEIKQETSNTVVHDALVAYVAAIVRATRNVPAISLGASPRAAVHLLTASKALARLHNRDFVIPDDVSFMARSVLRHRLVLRPEAELENYKVDDAVNTALSMVAVPR
jgi:MoxR-like ATPase